MSLETTRLKQELSSPRDVLASLGLLQGSRPQAQGYWCLCPRCGQDLSVRRVAHQGRQSPLMARCQAPACINGDVFSLIEAVARTQDFRETLNFATRLSSHIKAHYAAR